MNGIEAVDELRKANAPRRLFSDCAFGSRFVRACLAIGALGYIFKPRVTVDLLAGIREALADHLLYFTL